MSGYELISPKKPAEFPRYEDYYRHLMTNVKKGVDVEDNLNKLFSITYPVTRKTLNKWRNIEKDKDQLTPLVATAFMETVRHYDAEREDASFLKAYNLYITREVWKEYYHIEEGESVLKHKYRNEELRLDAIVDEDGTSAESYANTVPDTKSYGVDALALHDAIIHGVNDIFTDLEKQSMRKDTRKNLQRDKETFTTLVYARLDGDNTDQKEWGKRLDMTQSMVCRIWNKYLPMLEEYVMEAEE